MGGRTIYMILSPKRTPLQTGFDRWPHLWKMTMNQPHISYVILRP
jgi:hypothetical protein